MPNHRAILILFAFLNLAYGQQPTAITANPVLNQPKPAQLRVDAVHNVPPGMMYHRVWARVPLIGSGKQGDPKRPMFVSAPPTPGTKITAAEVGPHTGILAYQMQLSDDGKWALVEFVGATPQDLAMITTSADPNIKVFERGKATIDDIVADFKQYKKNFTFSGFTARPQ